MNNKSLISIAIILLISAIWLANAQVSPKFLEAHNVARAEVGVAPLKWNDRLAKSAFFELSWDPFNQGNCKLPNQTGREFYGWNQMRAGGDGLTITPRDVVKYWVAQKIFYNHRNNLCVPGEQCREYTQVVWRKTTELGCGQTQCKKDGSTLFLCYYYPPGNVKGESPY